MHRERSSRTCEHSENSRNGRDRRSTLERLNAFETANSFPDTSSRHRNRFLDISRYVICLCKAACPLYCSRCLMLAQLSPHLHLAQLPSRPPSNQLLRRLRRHAQQTFLIPTKGNFFLSKPSPTVISISTSRSHRLESWAEPDETAVQRKQTRRTPPSSTARAARGTTKLRTASYRSSRPQFQFDLRVPALRPPNALCRCSAQLRPTSRTLYPRVAPIRRPPRSLCPCLPVARQTISRRPRRLHESTQRPFRPLHQTCPPVSQAEEITSRTTPI